MNDPALSQLKRGGPYRPAAVALDAEAFTARLLSAFVGDRNVLAK